MMRIRDLFAIISREQSAELIEREREYEFYSLLNVKSIVR